MLPKSTVFLSKTSCAPESHEKLFKNSDVQARSIRAETIKLLEVNIHDLGVRSGFLDMAPKAQATKEKNR